MDNLSEQLDEIEKYLTPNTFINYIPYSKECDIPKPSTLPYIVAKFLGIKDLTIPESDKFRTYKP